MSSTGFWGRHRQAIGIWLLAVLVAVVCVALGRWQWNRFEDKRARKQLVEQNFSAPPVPLQQLLTAGSPFHPSLQWRRVRVEGRYDAGATTLVRNRPRDVAGSPAFGYEVLVPIVLDDGSALLVDRGWVANGTTGSAPSERPDAVPTPPAGRVEVVARLRPSERRLDRQTPEGQVPSIAIEQVGRAVGRSLYPAYGALVSESPGATPAPLPLGPPQLDGGEGINASYAVQWWIFAAAALGFPIWFRRHRRTESAGSLESAGTTQTVDGGVGDVRVAARPRRQRIWDDEDE